MQSLEAIDLGALFFFQHHHLPWLNGVMVFVTQLGNNEVLFPAATILALGLAARGRWRTALVLAATGLLGWGLTEGVKALVGRPRPAEAVDALVPIPTNGSYPSGHALNAMTVYGTAALLAARGLRSRRAAAVLLTAAFLLAVAVGASRLYLGVHYLTDVLGGWSAGLALALLARWVDERWSPLPAPLRPAPSADDAAPRPPPSEGVTGQREQVQV
jgi:undecaprenyl-diphosphatase